MLVDPIADLRSPSGSIISLYLDRPDPGGMSALMTDLLRPVRGMAESMPRPAQMSVRTDVDRIARLADRFEVDAAPSYAVFASEIDDIFVVESLTQHVESVAKVGPSPYVRPLRATPRPLRAGVLCADRGMARAFVATGELVEELGHALTADIGKSNYGGFGGYREHSVRARAGEAASRIWREAGARLLEVHQDRPLDYIAIGAADELVEEVAGELHSYLDNLYHASFPAHPQSLTPAILRTELGELAGEVRRNRQAALAGRVCDIAWSGGMAVLGLGPVLEHANAQAIETLVVAGPFARPGSICTNCGHLARTGSTCPVCQSRMFAVDDIVASAMDAVVAAGGDISQVGVASPLDVDGVGAITRFRLRT